MLCCYETPLGIFLGDCSLVSAFHSCCHVLVDVQLPFSHEPGSGLEGAQYIAHSSLFHTFLGRLP